MELIDKSALVAEIERRILEDYNIGDKEKDAVAQGAIASLKYYIEDTLEVIEEVLDENGKSKLMQKCVKTAYKRGYDMGVLQTTNKINHNTKEINIADMADNYYDALMQEASDWMDEGTIGHCRLAYYTGCKDVLNKIRKGE